MDRLAEGADGVWGELVRRVRRLRDLEGALASCLGPEAQRPAVRVAAFEHGRLILVTDSPVWASRLRYETPALRTCLGHAGVPVAHIELRVAPARVPAAVPAAPRRARLSGDGARVIRSCARGVGDPGLRAALERLAGRHRESDAEE